MKIEIATLLFVMGLTCATLVTAALVGAGVVRYSIFEPCDAYGLCHD